MGLFAISQLPRRPEPIAMASRSTSVILALASLLMVPSLISCSPNAPNASANDTAGERRLFSPTRPRPLQLDIAVTPVANGVRIDGRTNLPTGTLLMLELQRGPAIGGPQVEVQNGHFSATVIPGNGGPVPPGRYEVRVSTPLGDLQPAHVRDQLGSNYEALTGRWLVRDSLGRMIQYHSSVSIGGPPSAAADRDARRAAGARYDAFSARACDEQPATIERLTGRSMSEGMRRRAVADCQREMASGRREAERQGLVER